MSIPLTSPSIFCLKPSWQREAPRCGQPGAGGAGQAAQAGSRGLEQCDGRAPLLVTLVPLMWALCVVGFLSRQVPCGGGRGLAFG